MLSILKENAASCNNYVRMEDLNPGRYEIRKFSLRDSKFGGKRLVIDINKGYIFLPEKMTEKFNTEKAVAKLNKDRYDLVFRGKDDHAPYRLRFTFELHISSDEEDNSDMDNNDNKNNKNKGNRNHSRDNYKFDDGSSGSGTSGIATKIKNMK